MAQGLAFEATPLARRYARFVWRRWLLLAGLALAVLLSVAGDLATGPSAFPLAEVLGGLWNPDSLTEARRVILWEVRAPAAVMALVVGACLGLAGAQMQTVLDNPLAEPFTLGVSTAGAVGASLVIVLGGSFTLLGENVAIPGGAFACAAGATLLIQALSRRFGATADTVLLFGIGLLFTFEALLWLLQFIADSDALQQIVFWTMGSLSPSTWSKIALVAGVLAVCSVDLVRHTWALTALRAGEEQARSFGVAVESLRLHTLLRVSALSAAALAFVGIIGFVALVGPHIARLLVGEDHRVYLPASALAGALMLSLASILSKSILPGVVLPIGIVTALVGVPMFMVLVLARRRGR
ncbi:iron ABC transporter permease [Aquabacterium sp. A7-Y]|uniref:FecCD family ABC transporter permease n=1 Tax=Aquabacterium sp. A7-Y TaxID=1349605 RepID=UPI00223D38B9|nr:iron ABC transporter permease [Aquabacterium sp. A7-Y]MCW7539445.1 iron ABC transporter permease [Aquabacterium sp. A7-Y]